jgi:hypothetical protein
MVVTRFDGFALGFGGDDRLKSVDERTSSRSRFIPLTIVCVLLIVGWARISLATAPHPTGDRPFDSIRSNSAAAFQGADVPLPSECRISPRTVDEVVALYHEVNGTPDGTPIASTASPALVPAPASGEGVLANWATIQGVYRTYRERWACTNAQDALRALALRSDDGIRRSFMPRENWPPPEDVLLATLTAPPTPLPDDQRRAIVSMFDEVRKLPDGRVTALERVKLVSSDGSSRISYNLYVFVRPGERWLLDDTVADATPPFPIEPVASTVTTSTATVAKPAEATSEANPTRPAITVRVTIPEYRALVGPDVPQIGEQCIGAGAYADLEPATHVYAALDSGSVLGSSALGVGTVVDNFDGTSRCRFETEILLALAAEFRVGVGYRPSQAVRFEDLLAAHRVVTFEFGD